VSQSRNRRRELEGGKVKSVISVAKWWYARIPLQYSIAVLITFAVSAQLFAGEDGLEGVPNPIPIPVRVHISVLDSSQREDLEWVT